MIHTAEVKKDRHGRPIKIVGTDYVIGSNGKPKAVGVEAIWWILDGHDTSIPSYLQPRWSEKKQKWISLQGEALKEFDAGESIYWDLKGFEKIE